MVGVGNNLIGRAGTHRAVVGKVNLQFVGRTEVNLGHGRGVGFALVEVVYNGTVVEFLTGERATGNAGIAGGHGGGRNPSVAINAFFPFDKVEVSRGGQS